MFSKKDALDKRTTIERLLMIEKAILEEHDGRIASEHILRNLVEKQNDDYINAVERHGISPDVIIVDANSYIPGHYRDRVRSYELVGALQSAHDPRRLAAALFDVVS